MFRSTTRSTLPRPADRLALGLSGLQVSPVCLGICGSPETVLAAFDAGINFFFLTADLHWPLYEGLRQGLTQLFARRPSVRDQVVVGVVSYLDQPLFSALQFHEVIDAVAGLERVDLLIAGAVWNEQNFNARFGAILGARARGHHGARAIGASFHDRRAGLLSINCNCLEINFLRYNTAYTGAREEVFPYIRPDRTSLIYNFKSTMSQVMAEQFQLLGLNGQHWLPGPTDYYRFILTNPSMDGLLCSLSSPQEVDGLAAALHDRPLTPEEEWYMIWLSSSVWPRYF